MECACGTSVQVPGTAQPENVESLHRIKGQSGQCWFVCLQQTQSFFPSLWKPPAALLQLHNTNRLRRQRNVWLEGSKKKKKTSKLIDVQCFLIFKSDVCSDTLKNCWGSLNGKSKCIWDSFRWSTLCTLLKWHLVLCFLVTTYFYCT